MVRAEHRAVSAPPAIARSGDRGRAAAGACREQWYLGGHRSARPHGPLAAAGHRGGAGFRSAAAARADGVRALSRWPHRPAHAGGAGHGAVAALGSRLTYPHGAHGPTAPHKRRLYGTIDRLRPRDSVGYWIPSRFPVAFSLRVHEVAPR